LIYIDFGLASNPRNFASSVYGTIGFTSQCSSFHAGSRVFQLHLASPEVLGRTATSDENFDISESIKKHIPEAYHEFADVFSEKINCVF
jgi:hypothetical protein